MLALAGPAGATPPTDGSGTGTVTHSESTPPRSADGNMIVDRQNGGVLVGTFDGEFEQFLRGVIHKDGTVTFHGTMIFTGIAGDCGAGTVTLELEGKGAAGALPVTEGRMRTIGQSTSTVPVHVIGTFRQVGTAFAYEGQFHCD
jgi:hypothetical protein